MDAHFVALPRLLLTVALAAVLPATAAFAQDPAGTEPAPLLAAIEISGNTRTDQTLILREMDLRDRPALHLRRHGRGLGPPGGHRATSRSWTWSTTTPTRPGGAAGQVEEDMTTDYGPLVRYDRRHKYLLGGPHEGEQLPRPGRDHRGRALGLLHPARRTGLEAPLAVRRARASRAGSAATGRTPTSSTVPPTTPSGTWTWNCAGPSPARSTCWAPPTTASSASATTTPGICPTAARARPPARPTTPPAPATTGC